MNDENLPNNLKHKILVHIDDFCLAAKTKSEALFMQKTFDNLCKELNVIIWHEKDVNATQSATLYGFHFDLKNKTVGIPHDKLNKLRKFIKLAIKIKIMTGRALETLCGQIMHWSQLYKPAKSLCYDIR